MDPRCAQPLDFFAEWFAEPLDVRSRSVKGIVEALNRHPMSGDQTAQDYVVPASRAREHAGRFRIFRENQDVFFCFVYEGDETKPDPPVFFETCLDLQVDSGIASSDIINGNHVLVADRFSDFLWHMLGQHICLRTQSGGHFAKGVNGIVFDEPVELDSSFINLLGREFPVGSTCFVSDGVICIPGWGAAFLTAESREKFVARYLPSVSEEWAQPG